MQSDADRSYERWLGESSEANLVELYRVVLRRAKRFASALRLDYAVAYDLASELTLALRDGFRPQIKRTFSVWLDVRMRTDCMDAHKAERTRRGYLGTLDEAREIPVPAAGAVFTLPLTELHGLDRRIVALYLRGYTQSAIARRIHLTQQAVAKRLKNLANLVVKQAV